MLQYGTFYEFYVAVTLRSYFVSTICPEKCPEILEIFCPE